MRLLVLATAAGLSLAATVAPSAAHVMIEPEAVVRGVVTEMTFVVGHGCGGAATERLRVRVPDGVVSARPLDIDGWTTSMQANENTAAGEITWTGHLGGHDHGRFPVEITFAADAPTGPVLFPVVQECEDGEVLRWIETFEGGDYPAPGLTLH